MLISGPWTDFDSSGRDSQLNAAEFWAMLSIIITFFTWKFLQPEPVYASTHHQLLHQFLHDTLY